MDTVKSTVLVIGAGVVGLSTAAAICDLLPDVKVTVVADRFYEQTTSYGSGGLFVPSVPPTDTDNAQRYRQWAADSSRHFLKLATGPDAGTSGTMLMPGYFLAKTGQERNVDFLDGMVFGKREMTRAEMEILGFKDYSQGIAVTSFAVNQRKYLSWLKQRLQAKGVRFVKEFISDVSQLRDRCSVVVNCSGLGSRELFHDQGVYSLRGHLIKVRAPWIKHWIYYNYSTYIIPGEDLVSLGGTSDPGDETITPREETSRSIKERCLQLCPALKKAEVDHEWVGLRPCRDGIRLEVEKLNVDQDTLHVVHNYGHSSDGVAFSWGTALEAARHVRDLIKPRARL